MPSYTRIIVPYLMGQYRAGLERISTLDPNGWEILRISNLIETDTNLDEKMANMSSIYRTLAEKIQSVVEGGSVPIVIAGDCVASLGVLTGLQHAQRQPHELLWLDAHGDYNDLDSTPTQYIGGMPLAMLVGRGDQRIVKAVGLTNYPANQVILSDARDLDLKERKALLNSSIIHYARVEDIVRHLDSKKSIYLHWDTDLVDAPEILPALKYQVPNGPTYQDMEQLFYKLSKLHIAAISVSAWHADQDPDDITAQSCLKLLQKVCPNSSKPLQ